MKMRSQLGPCLTAATRSGVRDGRFLNKGESEGSSGRWNRGYLTTKTI